MNGGFTFRYAVRMPDGQLYPSRPDGAPDPAVDYSRPSAFRDLETTWAYILGTAPPQQQQQQQTACVPRVFDTREGAEQLLAALQQEAAKFGVTNWGGTVVCQLCTPFTPGELTQFADEVAQWLKTQGMAQ